MTLVVITLKNVFVTINGYLFQSSGSFDGILVWCIIKRHSNDLHYDYNSRIGMCLFINIFDAYSACLFSLST